MEQVEGSLGPSTAVKLRPEPEPGRNKSTMEGRTTEAHRKVL